MELVEEIQRIGIGKRLTKPVTESINLGQVFAALVKSEGEEGPPELFVMDLEVVRGQVMQLAQMLERGMVDSMEQIEVLKEIAEQLTISLGEG